MTKPFQATKELLEAIDHDVKLATNPVDAFVTGVLFPFLVVPPIAIADALRAPIDKLRELITKK